MMATDVSGIMEQMRQRLQQVNPLEKVGRVSQVTGLVIESDGPGASIGDVCEIVSHRNEVVLQAEVVGFRDEKLLLMPLGDMHHVHPGCQVVLSSHTATVPVGMGLLGRVIDGLGKPVDQRGVLTAQIGRNLRNSPPHPLRRQRILQPFETGVRAMDLFCPIGRGQRVGIFSGSGVGKSTLLGMIARGSEADVNVIALVGERGRELREFIEKDLGPEGMAKTVIVVSTSDQPALVRVRAALLATTIAENFRDEGKKVLFMMDSVTRFAMAQREIGLAVGEPPTSRGYTPSVFSILPRLLERTGSGEVGTITAFYTILVEGDDMNEPISDAVRGILDGHIVLSRALATANQYPAIDVLESLSRLTADICTPAQQTIIAQARDLLAIHRKNEDLINIGAYPRGSNAKIDRAIDKHALISQLLQQKVTERSPREESFSRLKGVLK